jgi:hypothetical protein
VASKQFMPSSLRNHVHGELDRANTAASSNSNPLPPAGFRNDAQPPKLDLRFSSPMPMPPAAATDRVREQSRKRGGRGGPLHARVGNVGRPTFRPIYSSRSSHRVRPAAIHGPNTGFVLSHIASLVGPVPA